MVVPQMKWKMTHTKKTMWSSLWLGKTYCIRPTAYLLKKGSVVAAYVFCCKFLKSSSFQDTDKCLYMVSNLSFSLFTKCMRRRNGQVLLLFFFMIFVLLSFFKESVFDFDFACACVVNSCF